METRFPNQNKDGGRRQHTQQNQDATWEQRLKSLFESSTRWNIFIHIIRRFSVRSDNAVNTTVDVLHDL